MRYQTKLNEYVFPQARAPIIILLIKIAVSEYELCQNPVLISKAMSFSRLHLTRHYITTIIY